MIKFEDYNFESNKENLAALIPHFSDVELDLVLGLIIAFKTESEELFLKGLFGASEVYEFYGQIFIMVVEERNRRNTPEC